MARIALGINTLTSVKRIAYSNHLQLLFRIGRNTKHEVILVNPERVAIDRMRNLTAKVALENKCDYLMFLDDDVIVPFDCLDKLIALDCDIAAGNVLIRGYPYENMFFEKDGKYVTHLKTDEMRNSKTARLEDLGAVGFSLALIKTSLFKYVPQPFFITTTSGTEDVYFCFKAREYKSDLSISVDLSIICGHILGDEIISDDNRLNYMRYYEKMANINPEAAKPEHRDDILDKIVTVKESVEEHV